MARRAATRSSLLRRLSPIAVMPSITPSQKAVRWASELDAFPVLMPQCRIRRALPKAFQVGDIDTEEHGDNLLPRLAGHVGIFDQHHLDAVRLKAAVPL